MPKLLLINPVGRRSGYVLNRLTTFQPLGLAYVAATTPSHWDIKIIDENFEQFKFETADLVGITAFTSTINRAYQIAKIYKSKKIKVIIGGIHASMLPNEALNYCDAVVIGEVEKVWKKVIADFELNKLQSRYKGSQLDLSKTALLPRRDLFDKKYVWQSVQTSRGCPNNCNFCSVTKYMGNTHRQRSAKDVIQEIKGIEGKYIAFVDDNLIGHSQKSRQRVFEIFQGIKSFDKKWWMQCSINIAEDWDLIKSASEAGCQFVLIGFETIDTNVLKEMQKGVNLKAGINNYKKVVRRLHHFGIAVLGAFIIGNSHENKKYYKKLSRFCTQSGIDMFQITILTPLPGTALMKQCEKSKNLTNCDFPKDWDKYRFSYYLFKNNGLNSSIVYNGNNLIKKRLYSFPVYQLRLLKSFLSMKNINKFGIILKYNQALKKGWENSHYFNIN